MDENFQSRKPNVHNNPPVVFIPINPPPQFLRAGDHVPRGGGHTGAAAGRGRVRGHAELHLLLHGGRHLFPDGGPVQHCRRLPAEAPKIGRNNYGRTMKSAIHTCITQTLIVS